MLKDESFKTWSADLQRTGEILVVDDMESNIRLLSNILVSIGHKVRTALNGELALMSIRSQAPDVVLLDIRMPKIDGYEVCRRIKADPATSDIPVIFISALNDTDDIVRAFEVGGVDYITKPFKLKEVLARVSTQITLSQQRKQIEENRQHEIEYFETLNRMKDQFIKAATHDLKNPLALIAGYASLLETIKPGETEEMQTFIDGVKEGVDKMLHLVTDMLDLLQMESGFHLELDNVSLSQFVAGCVSNFQFRAQEKQIQLTLDQPETDLTIPIDPFRVGRVMDNLLSNAIKYTPPGQDITVRVDTNGDYAMIEVQDTGYGIPEDALPRIFDPFYRVDNRQHRAEEGTGLGLSIAAAIIDQHNGEIQVESQVDVGSTFRIYLPL